MNRLKLLLVGCILVSLGSHARAATALPFGQVQSGTIGLVAQSNTYTFSASTNDVVDFTIIATSGKLSPKVNLYSPTGADIAYNYNGNPFGCSGGSNLEMNNIKLPAAGTYTVLIADCGDTNTGNYLIFVQRTNNPAGASNLPFGQVQTGTVGSTAQANGYTFAANAKDVFDFTIIATSGSLSPKINLFDPTGADIAYNYNGKPFGCSGGSNLEMNNIALSATGTYTVLIGDCTDTNTGNYTIFTQRTNNPTGATGLVFGGQPQTGAIGSLAQANSYTFGATAKDVVDFTIIATSGKLSPKINLFSPTGANVSYNYNGNPFGCSGGSNLEMNNITLPATGTYTVLIGDCSDTNTGNYSLSAQCFGVCTSPGSTVPPPAQPPQITSVSQISTQQIQTIVIMGSGFGTQAPYTGNSKYIALFDVTKNNWQAGNVGNLEGPSENDAVTLIVQSWQDSEIVLGGFSGSWGSGIWTLDAGDQVQIDVWNAQSSNGPASITTTVTGTAPPQICNYTLAPTSQLFPAAAGTGSVGVLTDPGCSWTASTASAFLSITSGSSGAGSGVVQFSATANTAQAARMGMLTIAGQTATINQAGTAPLLLLSPASIAVQWRQQSPLPIPIPLSVYTAANSLSYTAAASSPGNWLSVSPASGSAPATVIVSVNPSSLQPGPYQGTVTVTAPAANPPSQVFTVSLTVVAAGSPTLSLTTNNLSYSFAVGSQQVLEQRIPVGNSGGGTLSYQASASTTSGGNWLSVTEDTAGATPATPDLLTVNVNPSGLGAGTYTGLITIMADTTETIPVTVTVSAVQQTILLSQTGLTFTAVANGGIVPPQTFGILNSGSGLMNWSVSSTTVTGGNWLSIAPNSGTTDASSLNVPLITVSVNPANLTPGQYSGQIQVSSPTADDSPQFVSVILNVLPAGSNPGPLVLPTGLIFTQAVGGAAAGSQTVTLSNLTGSQQTFTTGKLTTDGANWFSVTPTSGTAAPTQATTLTVSVSSTGLTPAIRQGVLTLLFQDGSVRTVNVLFLLATGGVSSLGAGDLHPSAASGTCTPTKLLPLVTSLGSQFTVPAAWPNTLQTQVVDDCGNPHVSGTVNAAFSNGDPPLPLISLKNGNWTGTWQVGNTSASVIAITVTADNPSLNISGAISVSGGLQSSANAPVMTAGGVLNSASYAPSAPLAPGTMISIFGSNLANGTSSASTLPLSTQLAGTLVTIGGEPAPLIYADQGQINAIIPYGLPVNTHTQVIVRQGNAYTAPQSITLATASPAIFTKSSGGTGQGIVIRPDGQNAEPGTPAQAGDEVTIYAAGLGATTPGITAGEAATASPLLSVAGAVSLTIGGQNARVDFAGLVPGLVELYQINAAVPAGVQGDALPVVLTVAGQPSPVVTMAVQ